MSSAFPAKPFASAAPTNEARAEAPRMAAWSPLNCVRAKSAMSLAAGVRVPASSAPNASSRQRFAWCCASLGSAAHRVSRVKPTTRSEKDIGSSYDITPATRKKFSRSFRPAGCAAECPSG